MGLGFDDWDLEFYTKMFKEQLMRNPTDVECFDLGMNCCLEKSLTPSAAFLCVCVLTIRIDAVALVSRSTS